MIGTARQPYLRTRDYRSLVLSMGPVAYWRLAGGGGDESGDKPGTLTNGPAPAAPLIQRGPVSLAFDGVDDFVELGSVANTHPLALAGSAFTICCWMLMPDNSGDNYGRIIDKSTGVQAANGYALAVQAEPLGVGAGGRNYIELDVGGRRWRTNGEAYSAGVPVFVAATATASAYTIYVNAVAQASGFVGTAGVVLPPNATANARIGTWNHAADREFKGRMSDLAVFDRALAAELDTLYLAGINGHR